MGSSIQLNELVERAKRFENEAFAELYEQFYEKIYRFLLFKTGNVHEAEDLTEQTFLQVIEKITTVRKNNSFPAWLIRIANNNFLNSLKDKNRIKLQEIEEEKQVVVTKNDPKDIIDTKMLNQDLYQAIQQLTEDQQKVIILKFISGMTNKEIGKILGKREGSVKSLQTRALVSLSKLLNEVI